MPPSLDEYEGIFADEPRRVENAPADRKPPRSSGVRSAAIIAVVGAVIGVGLGFVGAQLLSRQSNSSKPSAAAAASDSPSAAPSPSPSAAPSSAAQQRTAPVAVYNGSGTPHLASDTATAATKAGWNVDTPARDWTGVAPSVNTVYAPASMEAQGRLLAADLGYTQVKTSTNTMRTDGLTVIAMTAK